MQSVNTVPQFSSNPAQKPLMVTAADKIQRFFISTFTHTSDGKQDVQPFPQTTRVRVTLNSSCIVIMWLHSASVWARGCKQRAKLQSLTTVIEDSKIYMLVSLTECTNLDKPRLLTFEAPPLYCHL